MSWKWLLTASALFARYRTLSELRDELRTFLRNRSNLVAAKAAKIIGERRISSLIPDLVVAAQNLFKDPARLDKRCAALNELVTALYELDYAQPDLYLKCIRHVQMEPSFGPPVDAAAQLRGFAAQGLIRTNHLEALDLIADLLVDPEPPARTGAVRALAANGGTAGNLLLRLKILTGDRVVEVIAECFAGMLLNSGSAPSESTVAFVAGYPDSEDPAIAEAAVLARRFALFKSSRVPEGKMEQTACWPPKESAAFVVGILAQRRGPGFPSRASKDLPQLDSGGRSRRSRRTASFG